MIEPQALASYYRKIPMRVRKLTTPIVCLSLYFRSGLRQEGWFDSVEVMMPVNESEEPIPWMNYPVIHFLENRLHSELTLFEFGSGNSTKWFAERVDSVVSVEHNPDWTNKVQDDLPDNSTLVTREARQDYIKSISEQESEKCSERFDVVVIDGKWRNAAVAEAVKNLDEKGVIILDDSGREDYNDSISRLNGEGFKSIKFQGMKPVARDSSTTSVFYRDENCLNL